MGGGAKVNSYFPVFIYMKINGKPMLLNKRARGTLLLTGVEKMIRRVCILCLCLIFSGMAYYCKSPGIDPGPESEVDAVTGGIIVAIFKKAGLIISKKAIQKGFTEKAAHQAVRLLQKNTKIVRIQGSKCFAIQLAGFLKVVLSSSKSEVLFAGSHESYNNYLFEEKFKKFCR